MTQKLYNCHLTIIIITDIVAANNVLRYYHKVHNQQSFHGPSIQDNPDEPVLSQRRDLLEQPLDFYEPDVLPATQPINLIYNVHRVHRTNKVSKHYRKTLCFGCLLFYRHGISTPCLTNSVKARTEGTKVYKYDYK